MENNKIILKSNFYFAAEYGMAWGWQVDHYEDGSISGFNVADTVSDEVHKDGQYLKISSVLLKAIDKWQAYFELNATDDYCYRSRKERKEKDTFDWDGWNKVGIRLAILVEQQIGAFYDEFYYGFASEDIDFHNIWMKTKGIRIK